ncbi:DUF2007 domain-containing protein [Sneathiella limimaris]|uniref:putative signal transducing protein n=1 Tax=Sneathiella limimaris TaxID=1964213 RepID=UPI00146E33E3|nr:DUF2007 domain-containing protein [Sneathiella limimaris]
MVELFRTNDAVTLSYLMAVLQDEGIDAVLLDQHTSVLEGSIGAIMRRVVVPEKDEEAARAILADIAPHELPEKKGEGA